MRFINLFRVSTVFVIAPLLSATPNYAFSKLATASAGTASEPSLASAVPIVYGCVGYTWRKGGDALYTCTNSFNKGKYPYNNVQAYHETWDHKIYAQWHTDTEAWHMYERDVPNVAGNVADPPPTELRFEHAYDLAAYDLGARHAQFAAADNLTYHF